MNSPLSLVSEYCKETRNSFNPELMERNNYDIPKEILRVIMACQRSVVFTLKVVNHYIIEDPIEVYRKLYQYEEKLSEGKKKKRDNPYEYINMKDTDIMLLCITYYAKVKEEEDTFEILVAIPRWVNKYYFRISGNLYFPMFQIVDGSTYNNSNTNSKKQSVTAKTVFMPIRVYRNSMPIQAVGYTEPIKSLVYSSRIFNKNLPALKYIFGKFGLYEGLNFMGVNCITFSKFTPATNITEEAALADTSYHFKKNDIIINVPKMIFDNDMVVQSIVSTIVRSIGVDGLYEQLFFPLFWKASLGYEFNNNYSTFKGDCVCESLEGLYDETTMETIALPMEHKQTIYHIIRWITREFSNLKIKDNMDFTLKKLRMPEYIAALYAMRLSKSIHRIADSGKRATVESLRKAITIPPMFLIGQISSCTLVNYRNSVTDLDSYPRVTLKGPSGLGDNDVSSISTKNRMLDPSQFGIIDPDTSNNSDPGIGGMLCPMIKTHGKFLSDFEEPLTWEQEYNQLLMKYRESVGIKEAISIKRSLLGNVTEEEQEKEQIATESIAAMGQLITPIRYLSDTTPYLEGSILEIEEVM